MENIIVIVHCICLAIVTATIQESCTTLNNQPGECIAIQQCRSLHKLLSSSLSTENRDSLSQSECGMNGSIQLVCCPNKFTIDDLPRPEIECGVSGLSITDFEYRKWESAPGDFPFSAMLHYSKRNGRLKRFLCGGALINQNYVITAAHCIRGLFWSINNLTLDSVRFGEHDTRTKIDCKENFCADPPIDIQVAETIVHENYEPDSISRANDIGLIRLARPVSYTLQLRPICLPIAKYLQNQDFSEMLVTGFGIREDNGRQLSYVQGQSKVDSFNLEECSNFYSNPSLNITDNQLCVHRYDNLCIDDSGGPLITKVENPSTDAIGSVYTILVGVLSFGAKNCTLYDSPGIFTRIDRYIDWIVDHMKK